MDHVIIINHCTGLLSSAFKVFFTVKTHTPMDLLVLFLVANSEDKIGEIEQVSDFSRFRSPEIEKISFSPGLIFIEDRSWCLALLVRPQPEKCD